MKLPDEARAPALSYAEAGAALYALSPLGVQLGTERLARVLRRLGDPQLRYPALHIAGTNGKGSTAALCAALLLAASRRLPGRPRVGLYTSPHLLRLTERVQVSDEDGALRECPPPAFAAALATVWAAAAARAAGRDGGGDDGEGGDDEDGGGGDGGDDEDGGGGDDEDGGAVALTFFEALTAAAFLHFAWRGVAVAVIETGLGGRLDATRLCRPLATAVTSIGLDHCELLGDTLPLIAAEKAGIFKPAVPAYVACDDAEALQVLRDRAAALRAPLWAYPSPAALLGGVPLLAPLSDTLAARLALAGAHQRKNAVLALALAQCAPAELAALVAQPEVQAEGLALARWPGRLETLRARLAGGEVELVLDGAHNGEGAAALDAWLQAQPARPLCVLFGVVKGKRVEDMLAPLRRAQTVILCQPPTPRGRDPESLRELLHEWGRSCFSTLNGGTGRKATPSPLQMGRKATPSPLRMGRKATPSPLQPPDLEIEPGSVAAALTRAAGRTPAGGVLLVYGSLFLLAEVRRLVLQEPADALVLQDPLR